VSLHLVGPHVLYVQASNAARSARRLLKDVVPHRGEPTPDIGVRGQATVALFAAWCVEHLVPKDDHADFVRVLRDAETALRQRTVTDELARAVRRWTTAGANDVSRRVPAWLAYSAASQVEDFCKQETGGANAFRTVVEVTAILDHREGHQGALKFVRALDDELRRIDVENALEVRHRKASSKIRRAVWRGGPNKRTVTFWLAELADGRYGLLAREPRRWKWTEGERDDVFALIPDAHFEEAVLAAKNL